jgi:hypothetical protein
MRAEGGSTSFCEQKEAKKLFESGAWVTLEKLRARHGLDNV